MIKSYQMFLESSESVERGPHSFIGSGSLQADRIAIICRKYMIRNWSINKDGLVDVDGDVDLSGNNLNKLPINFGKVSGDFSCSGNKLTSLEGCPDIVGGGFYCQSNKLTSLEFAPKKVGRNFWCNGNKLTSLEGCPRLVYGIFYCHYNRLTSLEFAPSKVTGDFYCSDNELVSLEGLGQADFFNADTNPISALTNIGLTMITKSISFPEAVLIHIKEIPDNELLLIISAMKPQSILDLNDFKLLNLLRTQFPKKYAEVMKLRDVSVQADLGELGF